MERPQSVKGPIKGLTYSVDGSVLAGFGTNNSIALWDTSDGHIIAVLTCQACASQPIALAFSDDALSLAVASASQIVWYAVP